MKRANPILFIMTIGFILCGGLMIYLGIDQLREISAIPKDHETTEAIIWDFEDLGPSGDGRLYKIKYVYYVGNEEFVFHKEVRRETQPVVNARVKVWYDWQNPSRGDILYRETWPGLIIGGAIFTFTPLVFLLSAGVFGGVIDFFKGLSLVQLLMGFLFLAFGAMVWMLSSETIVRIFSGVFMASGIFLCVKGIKFKEK